MPRDKPSVIRPSSTSTQRRNEVAKFPPSAKNPSSKSKQSQERDRSHRRPRRSRPNRATSHRISSRSWDWCLDFANARALDHSWQGIQWYVNDFTPDVSSKHTSSRNTDPNIVSNQTVSVPGRDQSSIPEPSAHAVDPKPAPDKESDWKSTAYATTKLVIDLAKESSDAFPPLKSVVGGLSAILNHCEVRHMFPRLYRS